MFLSLRRIEEKEALMMVAMKIFDNPTQENKLLREYVDNYVDKFSF